MSYIASENILDEPIPSSFKSSTIFPTPVGFALQKLKQFGDWIISYIPEPIKKTTSNKLKSLFPRKPFRKFFTMMKLQRK